MRNYGCYRKDYAVGQAVAKQNSVVDAVATDFGANNLNVSPSAVVHRINPANVHNSISKLIRQVTKDSELASGFGLPKSNLLPEFNASGEKAAVLNVNVSGHDCTEVSFKGSDLLGNSVTEVAAVSNSVMGTSESLVNSVIFANAPAGSDSGIAEFNSVNAVNDVHAVSINPASNVGQNLSNSGTVSSIPLVRSKSVPNLEELAKRLQALQHDSSYTIAEPDILKEGASTIRQISDIALLPKCVQKEVKAIEAYFKHPDNADNDPATIEGSIDPKITPNTNSDVAAGKSDSSSGEGVSTSSSDSIKRVHYSSIGKKTSSRQRKLRKKISK